MSYSGMIVTIAYLERQLCI